MAAVGGSIETESRDSSDTNKHRLTNGSNESSDQNEFFVPAIDIPKHRLQYEWVMWYCKNDPTKQWDDNMKQVLCFSTVEDFWAMYNSIQLPSLLSFTTDYYLFKKGIKPAWEDVKNCDGGRWLITVNKQRREEMLDFYWLELILAMIGEQFDDYSDSVSGAVVNIRNKGDKVSLWTSDARDQEGNMRIGEVIKQKLGMAMNESICYEMHIDTKHKRGSMVKPLYRV